MAGRELPAVTITAQAGGQQVQAHLAQWNASPRIVIFWFSPSTGPGHAPHHLTAYNAAGHSCPPATPPPATAEFSRLRPARPAEGPPVSSG